MTLQRALGACVVLALAACERPPGPLEGERDAVTFWRALGSEVSYAEACTDDEDFRAQLDGFALPENAFFIYRVNGEGTDATAQACETTIASTCTESETGINFVIEDTTLVFDPEPRLEPFAQSECSLALDELWTMSDAGETGQLDVSIALDLDGPALACADIETQVRESSPNGRGVIDCAVTIGIDLIFSHVGR